MADSRACRHDLGLLGVFPIVVRSNQCSSAIVQFQRWIGQYAGDAKPAQGGSKGTQQGLFVAGTTDDKPPIKTSFPVSTPKRVEMLSRLPGCRSVQTEIAERSPCPESASGGGVWLIIIEPDPAIRPSHGMGDSCHRG